VRVGLGEYSITSVLGFYAVAAGFKDSVWVEATARELMRNRKIRYLYEFFENLMPNHPSPDNTFFTFIYSPTSMFKWRVIMLCKHFEHNSKDDMLKIAVTLMALEDVFGGEAYLAYLNGNAETVVFEVLDADGRSIPEKVRKLIREHVGKEK